MNKYESFAVGHYLSSWPENMSYEKIIETLNSDIDTMVLWPCGIYEDLPRRDVAYLIQDMADTLKIKFG